MNGARRRPIGCVGSIQVGCGRARAGAGRGTGRTRLRGAAAAQPHRITLTLKIVTSIDTHLRNIDEIDPYLLLLLEI